MTSEPELIKKQVDIHIDREQQLYVADALHIKPHGGALYSEREYNNNILTKHGCEIINLSDYDIDGEQHIPGVVSNYTSSCRRMREFMEESFDQDIKERLAKFVLKNGKADNNRDSSSDVKRLFAGFGRGQPHSEFLDGVKMPTFNAKDLKKMDYSLLIAISRVLSFAQQRLQDYLELAGKNTIDELRRKYVRGKWDEIYREHGVDVDWNFEFIDINVRSDGGLLRHCDYKNDSRKGHDGCVVFSYSIDIDDITYRVVMVTTTRCTVGKSFQRIHENAEKRTL